MNENRMAPGALTCARCGRKVNVLVGRDCYHCSRLAPPPLQLVHAVTPMEKALHELDPEALRENGEAFAPPAKLERMIPLRKAYQMVERLLRATYDVVDGQQVCRICRVSHFDTPSGHAKGCDIPDALEDVLARESTGGA